MKPEVGDIIYVQKKLFGFHKRTYYFRIDKLEETQTYDNHHFYTCCTTPLNRDTQASLQSRLSFDDEGYISFHDDEIIRIDLANRIRKRLKKDSSS